MQHFAVVGALNPELKEPGFESYVAMSNIGQVNEVITLHGSSSLSCMNKHLVVNSGGYLCTNRLTALITTWLNASQRWRSIEFICQGVKCIAL